MIKLVNLNDYEQGAAEKMAQMYFDYYASGADDEITLRENVQAYRRLKLQYRVLRDIDTVDTRITLLGQELAMPVLIAPMAFQKLAHPEGEMGMVRAAAQAGTAMILSTVSTTPMEEVMSASTLPVWFQLYMYRDRGITKALIERAQAAGCQAIALTVDTPILGKRERDERNSFQLPPNITLSNLMSTDRQTLPDVDGSSLATYTNNSFKMSLGWADVDWLCANSQIPVLLKGVCHPDDAVRGLEHGVGGIIVSNHGGRQLDTAPATIEVLPEIAHALHGRLPLLIDGGIRRGTDVVKALALGADAVCIGRPALWGLAVDGQAGVTAVLELLHTELRHAMTLCGVKAVADITPDFVWNALPL